MPDHATSTDPAVQAQLNRLFAHGPGTDVLGLDRITRLLARLGDPHLRLPRTFHVAGTNGKGSTCAFLRAILEASGRRVHVYTSPHLVRFNERIRLAGRLIDDDALAPLLAEVIDLGEGIGASFFEITTAAAFLAFSRTPADDCVIEVGLGGRLDATNVIPAPAACGIASLGIDHEAFLLVPEAGAPTEPHERIGWEKAGIFKPGATLASLDYADDYMRGVAMQARAIDGRIYMQDADWWIAAEGDGFRWRSRHGDVGELLRPAMAGGHQWRNAGLAIAMLWNAKGPRPSSAEIARGIAAARWPARMQQLRSGPLTATTGAEAVWLDGGHNPDAAQAVAAVLADQAKDRAVTLVLGMLANKNARAMIAALAPLVTSLIAVAIPGHEHHTPEALAALARDASLLAATASDLPAALAAANTPAVLIAGSLYLAGEALRLNDELPD